MGVIGLVPDPEVVSLRSIDLPAAEVARTPIGPLNHAISHLLGCERHLVCLHSRHIVNQTKCCSTLLLLMLILMISAVGRAVFTAAGRNVLALSEASLAGCGASDRVREGGLGHRDL